MNRTLTSLALALLTACGGCGGDGKPSDPIDDDWFATRLNGESLPWTSSSSDYQYGEVWITMNGSASGEYFNYQEYNRSTSEGCEAGYDVLDTVDLSATRVSDGEADTGGAETGAADGPLHYELEFAGTGLIADCTLDGDALSCDGVNGAFSADFVRDAYSDGLSDLRGVDGCD